MKFKQLLLLIPFSLWQFDIFFLITPTTEYFPSFFGKYSLAVKVFPEFCYRTELYFLLLSPLRRAKSLNETTQLLNQYACCANGIKDLKFCIINWVRSERVKSNNEFNDSQFTLNWVEITGRSSKRSLQSKIVLKH